MAPCIRDSLGYAGLLPFILTAVLMWWPGEPFQLGLILFTSYSALIASFMAGSLWGHGVYLQGQVRNQLFIVSNILCLLAWGGLLVSFTGHEVAGLVLLGFIFGLLFIFEKKLLTTRISDDAKSLSSYYGRLRQRLTIAVIASHVVAVAALVV